MTFCFILFAKHLRNYYYYMPAYLNSVSSSLLMAVGAGRVQITAAQHSMSLRGTVLH